jgi:hypothetical protein
MAMKCIPLQAQVNMQPDFDMLLFGQMSARHQYQTVTCTNFRLSSPRIRLAPLRFRRHRMLIEASNISMANDNYRLTWSVHC